MRFSLILTLMILLSGFYSQVSAQKEYPPKIECSAIKTFKNIDGVDLKLWVFNPLNHTNSDKTPAIVFFFGGGWRAGSPEQFVPQCQYLAERGMVAMVADYRVFSRNNVPAYKCISDAKSAIRWVRKNAKELGIDPGKIAAGGGSAGGQLAAATAVLPKFDEANEDSAVSSVPDALVLFNPALVLASNGLGDPSLKDRFKNMNQRFSAEATDISPYHNLKKGTPPTIIFHGIDDNTVPFSTAKMFAEKVKEQGDKCILVAYEGESHGFFNYGKKKNAPFADTSYKMDQFLSSIGFLQGAPNSIEY
ncbi:alpha/beta hydrolase [Sunxiuqinia sp. A32]|uniref:alpha/beta hydrolase n=1 Tax=Sunxiuqinia sp. A32 TaxID=3461496 RepID=UPI004045E7E5